MSPSATAVRAVVLAGLVLSVTAVGPVGSAAGGGAAPTEITNCTTIDEPGRYVIAANQTYSGTIGSTACIVITADNVVLDGGGTTFDGRGISNTTGIRIAGAKNVVVKNLNVADWHYGVHFLGASGGKVQDVTIRHSVYGLVLERSTGVTVTDGRFDRNLVGVRIQQTGRNDLRRDNRFTGNQVPGVHQMVPVRAPGGTMLGPPADRDGDLRFEDVNGDGSVDGDDSMGLAFVALGERLGAVELSADQESALDVNGDGHVDVFDAVEIAS